MCRSLALALAVVTTTAAAQPGTQTISGYGSVVSGMGANAHGCSPANLFVDAGRPVAAYGVVKARGGAEAYGYFVVFKSDPAAKPATFRTGGRQSSAVAKVTSAVHAGDAEKWAYTVEIATDRDTGAVTKEVLTAGGKEYQLADGRVFLVDLTADKPAVKVVKAAPPKPVPSLAKDGDAIGDVAKAVARLRADSKEVREFLGAGK